jgi:rhodanese-related sulfurtransferase
MQEIRRAVERQVWLMDGSNRAGMALSRRSVAAALVLALFVALLAAGCGGDDDSSASPDAGSVGQTVAVNGGSFVRITPAELQSMLQDKDFPLINVHIPFEGEIEGTDSHLPYDEILQRLGELPSDKNAKVVIYCRSGNMSTQAAGELVQAGYTNIYELGGGMIAWTDAGLPLNTEG